MGIARFLMRRWAAHNKRLLNDELYKEQVFGDRQKGRLPISGWSPTKVEVDAATIPGQPDSRQPGPQ